MQPQFDQVQIERYIKGQMVAVEMDIFENRMREDNVLMAEVKAFARINELELPDREVLKKPKSKVSEVPQAIPNKKRPLKWGWLIFLLLLFVLLYYFVAK